MALKYEQHCGQRSSSDQERGRNWVRYESKQISDMLTSFINNFVFVKYF